MIVDSKYFIKIIKSNSLNIPQPKTQLYAQNLIKSNNHSYTIHIKHPTKNTNPNPKTTANPKTTTNPNPRITVNPKDTTNPKTI